MELWRGEAIPACRCGLWRHGEVVAAALVGIQLADLAELKTFIALLLILHHPFQLTVMGDLQRLGIEVPNLPHLSKRLDLNASFFASGLDIECRSRRLLFGERRSTLEYSEALFQVQQTRRPLLGDVFSSRL
nr:hypothetical protein Itr_chr03CG14030 [Ipomoea trifida]